MRQANYLFYLVLFLGFFLPSNSIFFIPIAGAEVQVRELAFLLLPIVNLVCSSPKRVKVAGKKLQSFILLFFITIFLTEYLKTVYYGGGLGNMFRTIRIGLPLFSCLIIIYFGIRANMVKVWKTLLWAISASAVLTILTPFVHLPIYPVIEGANIIEATKGRFINYNASFGIIGIYLLYKGKNKWYNQGWLPFITAILSIIILIVSFNRTYLTLVTLAGIYLTFSTFSMRNAVKYISIPLIALGVVWSVYNFSNVVQRQVDMRIIDVLIGRTDLIANVYEGNREIIFNGVKKRINEGYWVFGLPIGRPIFTWPPRLGKKAQDMSATDTTAINILLRYGFIPFVLSIIIFIRLYKLRKNNITLFIMIIYCIASLNIDTLLRQNSILFLTIILYLYDYKFSRRKLMKQKLITLEND